VPGTPLRALLLTLLVAAPAGGAVTVARAPHDATAIIQACVRKDGRLRLVAQKADCRRTERPISWNVRGAHGEPGPQGRLVPPGPTVLPARAVSTARPDRRGLRDRPVLLVSAARKGRRAIPGRASTLWRP
jgi:hypothetical protein